MYFKKKLIFLCITLLAISLLLVNCGAISSKSESQKDKYKLKLISTKKLSHDLNYFFEKLELVHPNPYLFVKKTTIYKIKTQIEAQLQKKKFMNYLEFWKLISPIAILIRDHHTTIFNDTPDFTIFKMPISTTFSFVKFGNKYYSFSTDKNFKKLYKKEIVAINGLSFHEIMKTVTLYRWFSGYGYIDEFKNDMYSFVDYTKLSTTFFALFGFKNSITFTYRENNLIKEQRVPLYPTMPWSKYGKRGYMPKLDMKTTFFTTKPFRVKILNPNIAYLKARSFSIKNIDNYRNSLKQSFTLLKKKKIQNLIIDIRYNGGGSDAIWALLFNYLYSGKYKINYKNHSMPALKWFSIFNKNIYKGKLGKFEDYQWKKNKYTGKIYLLTNSSTFSAAVNFANAMKFYKVARLVGENTGGYATHFGEAKRFSMPNSKITFDVSSKYFISLDGNKTPQPVKPHIIIRPTLNELINITDFALKRTIELIKRTK